MEIHGAHREQEVLEFLVGINSVQISELTLCLQKLHTFQTFTDTSLEGICGYIGIVSSTSELAHSQGFYNNYPGYY